MKIEKEERLPDEDRYDPSVGSARKREMPVESESEQEIGRKSFSSSDYRLGPANSFLLVSGTFQRTNIRSAMRPRSILLRRASN